MKKAFIISKSVFSGRPKNERDAYLMGLIERHNELGTGQKTKVQRKIHPRLPILPSR